MSNSTPMFEFLENRTDQVTFSATSSTFIEEQAETMFYIILQLLLKS